MPSTHYQDLNADTLPDVDGGLHAQRPETEGKIGTRHRQRDDNWSCGCSSERSRHLSASGRC